MIFTHRLVPGVSGGQGWRPGKNCPILKLRDCHRRGLTHPEPDAQRHARSQTRGIPLQFPTGALILSCAGSGFLTSFPPQVWGG